MQTNWTKQDKLDQTGQKQCSKQASTINLRALMSTRRTPKHKFSMGVRVFMSSGEGKAIWLALRRNIFPPRRHHKVCATSLPLFAPRCHR